MTSIRQTIQARLRSAALQYALFRWESAVVIAITLLLAVFLPRPFPGWPGWGWPALGLLGWAALFYASLTDPETHARLRRELYQQQLDPKAIQDTGLRRQFWQALETQQRLELIAARAAGAEVHTWREGRAEQLADWLSACYALSKRIDEARREPRLTEARAHLPQEIETLASRRRFERNPQALLRLGESAEGLGKRWEALRQLDALLQQSDALLNRTLEQAAALVTQIPLLTAEELAAGRGVPLEAALQAQTDTLSAAEQAIAQALHVVLG